jgi:7,8-dihydroneopterin aldolase/epimerase/oxygenase
MTVALFYPQLSDCRRLFLRNYEVMIRIGHYESEKRAAQRVLIDVDMYVPLACSTPKTDQLGEVLDYNLMRDTIRARMEQGHIHLQETLCDDVAQTILAHPQVRAVRVASMKPDAYPDCEGVGVEVFFMKPAEANRPASIN